MNEIAMSHRLWAPLQWMEEPAPFGIFPSPSSLPESATMLLPLDSEGCIVSKEADQSELVPRALVELVLL